ncbi:hypothetical protein [Altererythrobacter fulvus]
MSSRGFVAALAVIVLLVLALAWFDGGEQPLRQISQPVAMPGDFR